MKNDFENMLPLKVQIEIGEPWDFEIDNGSNTFIGMLRKKITGEDKQDYYLVDILKPFMWKGETIKHITISTRYEGKDMATLVKPNEEIMVGIGNVKDLKVLTADRFTFKQVEYFAIGSVRKALK